MDSIKLTDGFMFEIEDGASISCIRNISDGETDAAIICAKLTYDNVTHVEFWAEGSPAPYGVYDDMILIAPPTRRYEEVGSNNIITTFGLRKRNEVEHRLAELEALQALQRAAIEDLNESQALQDGAIEDLGEIVSELYPEEEE